MKKLFKLLLVYLVILIITASLFFTNTFCSFKFFYENVINNLPIQIVNDKVFHFIFFFFCPFLSVIFINKFVKINSILNFLSTYIIYFSLIFLIEIMQPVFNRSYDIKDIEFGIYGFIFSITLLIIFSICSRFLCKKPH